MNCPNCQKILKENLCRDCGIDAMLFKKVVYISNRLYNIGLIKASNKDLTGAIDFLFKSVEFNKNNFKARNVLGLVYFQIGLISDAIKQWVTSINITKVNNLAVDYLEVLNNNIIGMEKLDDAIIMYNKSLKSIEFKNEDLAIIQLKKSIDLNNNFLYANNLLALLYMSKKEFILAKKCVDKVLAKDLYNKQALTYNRELSLKNFKIDNKIKKEFVPKKNIKKEIKKRDFTIKTEKKIESKVVDKKQTENKNKNIYFALFGVFLGLFGAYVLAIPLLISDLNNEIKQLEYINQTQVETQDKINAENEALIQYYKLESEELKYKSSEYDRIMLEQEKLETLETLETLMYEGEYLLVAEIISRSDFSMMNEEYIARIEELKQISYSKVTRQYYNSGINYYNSGEYDKAKLNFEAAKQFALPTDPLTPDILYYLGLIAEINSDFSTAESYFQEVVTMYPNTKSAYKAQEKLDNI